MFRSRLNPVFLCASVIPFALIPVTAAVRAHTPVLPPPVESVVIDSLAGAISAGLLVFLACAAGLGLRVATTAVSAGLFVFGQYPAVQTLVPEDASSIMPAIAWVWTLASVAIAAFVIQRRPGPGSALHQSTNVGAVVLTLFFGNAIVQAYAQAPTSVADDDGALSVAATSEGPRPDIYHIVVDGFGHPDVLRSMYDVDVSHEIEELRRSGFTISSARTFANYAQTYLSLASILNAEYLQALATLDAGSPSRAVVRDLIQESRVVRTLKSLGYTFELLSGPYSATEAHHLADRCECSRPLVGEFESTLIRLLPVGHIGLGGLDHIPHRRKVLRTLNALEHLPASDGPRLVLAHILAPHPPFVFGAHGEAADPPRAFTVNDGTYFAGPESEYQSGYRAQALFIASWLPRIAAHLEALSRSQGRDSVIVIHGDHGPRRLFDAHDASRSKGAEALPVLLAIRWTSGESAPRVNSLVNIYRAIFKRYFVTDLEQLPDRAFLSSFDRPYAFLEVDPVTLEPR